MKTCKVLLAGLVVMAVATVRAGEEGMLVKVVGMDHKAEWQTMSENDFKTLEKTLKLEQKVFSKAVENAGKEWRTDELNKGIPFPGGRLMPRTISTSQPFPSLEKAEAQLSKIQDQEAKKLEKQAEKDKNAKGKPKSKDQDKKEAEVVRAIDLVQAKLMELVAKAGGDTNAMAAEVKADLTAKPEAKVDAKDAKGAKADAKGAKAEKEKENKGAKKGDAKAEAVNKAL